MRILIRGGAGVIGANVADAFIAVAHDVGRARAWARFVVYADRKAAGAA